MKKILAALLAAVLALSLAACSGGAAEPSATAAPTAKPTAAPVESATPAPVEEGDDLTVKLPLADDKVTFTMWLAAPSAGADMVTENDSLAIKTMEERANVHIEFEHPALGQEATAFNLMMASQSYTDAISANLTYYIGGLDKYIDDEIIVPLEDYGEYYPNYNYWRSLQELSQLVSVTDSGHVAAMFQIRYPGQPAWQGPIVREDLLDDIGWTKGLDGISTYSDWEELLTLFRDYKDGMIPYYWDYNMTTGLNGYLLAGFGLYNSGGFFRLNDNVVHYSPYEAAYKDYLALCADWYAKGLIDPNFYTIDFSTSYTAPLQGNAGVATTYKAYLDYLNTSTEGDGAHWEGISSPVKQTGDKFEAAFALVSRLYYQTQSTTISCDCDEALIPIILQYFDYLYTDEGSLLANYGVEGETFHYGSDGNIIIEDYITKNADGYSFNQQINKYAMFQKFSFRYNWLRTETNISEQARTIYQKWEANFAENLVEYPSLSIAPDKATEYANLYTEINTYVGEYTLKIITGQEDLNATWDAYIQRLEQMRVADMISMQQDALDLLYTHDLTVGMN